MRLNGDVAPLFPGWPGLEIVDLTSTAANSREARRPVIDDDSVVRFRAKCSPVDDVGHVWWLGAIDRNAAGKTVWRGGVRRGGYGRFQSGSGSDAVVVTAHRYAWLVEHGDITDGQVVRHRCDEPSCVSIDHLELGTVADNNADASARGRFAGRSRDAHLDSRGPAGRSMAIRAAVVEVLATGTTDPAAIGAAARAAMHAGEQWRDTEMTLW